MRAADPGDDDFLAIFDRGFGLDLAVLAARILDLLQLHDALGHALAAALHQQRVDVAGVVRIGTAVAAHDHGAGHAASDLQRGRAMHVRVIPERARGMIRGNVVFVLELHSGQQRDQHVVAVAGRADPESVRMQVRAVETMRNVDVAHALRAVGLRRQLVVECDAHGLARLYLDQRRDERNLRVGAGAAIRAQLHAVVDAGSRVVDRRLGEVDVEVESCFMRRRCRQALSCRPTVTSCAPLRSISAERLIAAATGGASTRSAVCANAAVDSNRAGSAMRTAGFTRAADRRAPNALLEVI